MKRTAIILKSKLPIGQAANIAAILMGQASRLDSELFNTEAVVDMTGVAHAAVRFSIVVLEANGSQIASITQLPKENGLISIVFSELGQTLHNKFEEYEAKIHSGTALAEKIVGAVVSGEDELVRKVTKKFSLLK